MNGSGGQSEAPLQDRVAFLNVHCGLGAGEIVGVHVGDDERRREYLILGDPLAQVATAAASAALGEFKASPQALEILQQLTQCVFRDGALDFSACKLQPTLIAYKKHCDITFNSRTKQQSKSIDDQWTEWEAHLVQEYRNLMCLYVHPAVVECEIDMSDHPRLQVPAQQRHIEEAELRNVYVMFIMPKVDVTVTGDYEQDAKLFNLLNKIMNITTRELDRWRGHLRQFIVDDKGATTFEYCRSESFIH